MTTSTTKPPTINVWSILALVFSIGMCPLVTAVGFLLGLVAIRQGRRHPGLKGRRVAIIALVISGLMTPVTTWGVWWWVTNVRTPLMRGPIVAIELGQQGDVAGFRDRFLNPGDEVEAAAFLSAVTNRWGELVSSSQDPSRDGSDPRDGCPCRVPYLFTFTGGEVAAEAEFVILDGEDEDRRLECRFVWVRFIDEDRGTLLWPPSATGVPTDE
jgi:hypothetical protein